MRFLIDIGHPAHVHLFKNVYFELKKRNHDIFITVKNIPAAKYLLYSYNMKYIDFNKPYERCLNYTCT